MNKKLIGIVLAYLLFGSAHGLEVSGVKLADTVQLDGSATPLILNGAGTREKFFFEIYVGALYLPRKSKSVSEILAMKGPKRIAMHFLYKEVEKKKLIAAWSEGFENNQSADTLTKLSTRLKTFNGMFSAAHKGDVILLDYLPGKGTTVTINGTNKGIIPGEDFNAALLAVWLGNKPADDDLKDGMLGL